jgi:4,5-DOPA dioxygenase extradiol
MREQRGDVRVLLNHPDCASAVPTPDHFLPLLYVAGIVAAASAGASPIVRGCTLGSVSMTCYGVGVEGVESTDGGTAAGVPNVPPDETVASSQGASRNRVHPDRKRMSAGETP